uniref:Uncharacterized protein n=1 Tax=Lotharella globosa TaxID=91324 RepID=A0A7S3Z1P1_9EUKA
MPRSATKCFRLGLLRMLSNLGGRPSTERFDAFLSEGLRVRGDSCRSIMSWIKAPRSLTSSSRFMSSSMVSSDTGMKGPHSVYTHTTRMPKPNNHTHFAHTTTHHSTDTHPHTYTHAHLHACVRFLFCFFLW